jgi:hypothetical protein
MNKTAADGRAGAGHTGNQGAGLAQAEVQTVLDAQVLKGLALLGRPVPAAGLVTGRQPVGDTDDQADHDQRRRGDAQIPERALDLVLERQTQHADRDRADDHQPARPRVPVPAHRPVEQ